MVIDDGVIYFLNYCVQPKVDGPFAEIHEYSAECRVSGGHSGRAEDLGRCPLPEQGFVFIAVTKVELLESIETLIQDRGILVFEFVEVQLE